MTWETSKTGRFGQTELKMLEEMPIKNLIWAVLSSQPLVALRVFAELMLQEDKNRYMALVHDPNVKNIIAAYNADPQVSQADHIYATIYSILVAEEQV